MKQVGKELFFCQLVFFIEKHINTYTMQKQKLICQAILLVSNHHKSWTLHS